MAAPTPRIRAKDIARQGKTAFVKLSPWAQAALAVLALVVLVMVWHALSNPVAQAKLIVGTVTFMVIVVPLSLLFRRAQSSWEKSQTFAHVPIQPGYGGPAVEWRNVYTGTRPVEGTDVYILDFPFYSEGQGFKVQRSNMPQFRVWYWPPDYWCATERSKSTDHPAEWAETIDGNPRLGTNPAKMPIYLQKPFKMDGDRLARLYLYEITEVQAKRLAEGPPRQEDFTVINYETKQSETLRLNVGSKGGKFRQTVNAKTDAHGTAEPVGLRNMDPAPDPHGSAQAGGLGDMHLS